MSTHKNKEKTTTDVVLIGAGIMSATLGAFLKELQPDLTIEIYERLDLVAAESSDAWNNAGTGHSAFCELNYTPEKKDGSVEINKALKIAEDFEISRQFWSYLVQKGALPSPENFIHSIPHISFVWGDDNVNFLKTRFESMQKNHLFNGMEYSEDFNQLKKWMPLVMEGRDKKQKIAATYMAVGTDVNFGSLTRSMFNYLKTKGGVKMRFNHEVKAIDKNNNGTWDLSIKNLKTGRKKAINAKFVFIGAGGGSLPLLEKSDIKEGKGFGGFPVSGQWLKCTNPKIIEQHQAKVYGKASVGAPPMSVPHLDTRMINGEKALLFGPYAGFTTKFLKNGSYLDLALSIKAGNIGPMLSAGWRNIPLTKYLINQVRQSQDDRMDALREYFPNAKSEDWVLETAGQRVQVIKKDLKKGGGVLEFGTEVVSAADGSLAALLGASPGASTAVSIMLSLMKKCFKNKMSTKDWKEKLKQMIPSYGQSLIEDGQLCYEIRTNTTEVLKLQAVNVLQS